MNQTPSIHIETTDGSEPHEADRGWIEQEWIQRPQRRSGSAVKRTLRAARRIMNGRPTPQPAGSLLFPRPLPPGQTKIDGRFAIEQHHHSYRRPWCLGRDHFDYLVSRGLQRYHSVLDFGCGCLRTGIWLVDFLDEGRYFGLDSHYKSLEAAAAYEIPLHGLQAKRPRLLWNSSFACEHFGEKFNWILAFSVLNWLGEEKGCEALEHMIATLKPGGRIVTYVESRIPEEELRRRYGLVVTHQGRHESKFFNELSEFTEFVLETTPDLAGRA